MCKRRLRVQRIPEDAAESQELITWEKVDRPAWHCESCRMFNDGHEDSCAYCGKDREDGWL